MAEESKNVLASPFLRIFRYALPLQVKLQEVARAMGGVRGLRCLNVGDDCCAFSYHLRRLGGEWSTVVDDEACAESVRGLVDSGVCVWNGGELPFENKTFDVVVVLDMLARVESDQDLIEQCHRVLKPTGRLVLTAANRKGWTAVNPLRAMTGNTPERRGLRRPGYVETELFGLLKHGFDLNSMRTFSRFFVEAVDTLVLGLGPRPRREAEAARAVRRYAIAALFYRVAFQLDMLLLFARGFTLLVTGKRRAWLPRKTPVLTDGRSISEAVLSRPGALRGDGAGGRA